MKRVIWGVLALALFMLAGVAPAATLEPPAGKKKTVRAFRRDCPIAIDGRLDEPGWKAVNAVTEFVQRDPVEGAEPTERTQVDILYDDEAIYIGAHMFDSAPHLIEARLGRRDVSATSDAFFFFVDPYHDLRTGFYFGLSAAGTKYDGTLQNDGWDDDSWDSVWDGEVRRDDQGWTAEMRIPYSQLRFQKSQTYTWGVNFKREIARKNEQIYLVYTPKNEQGFVSRFPELVGIENISPPRRMELVPYMTTKAEYTNPEAGNPFDDGSGYSPGAGADVKLGIGTNLTLDATVNPDFGQVEVDPAVVNLSDVETFYPEKRPFFVEGASIFNFGQGGATNYWGFNWAGPDFFYSRRIGRAPQGATPDNDFEDVPEGANILGAAKLSGKIGGDLSIGMLNAFTARERASIDMDGQVSKAEVEPAAYYGVYRGLKELDEARRGLGFITTVAARMFDDPALRDEVNSHSLTFGVDGWTFLDANKTWVITGWTGLSSIGGDRTRMIDVQEDPRHYFQRPDADHVELDPNATSLTGYAGRVYLNKEKGNTFLNSAIGFVSPKFDVNDLGFQGRGDQINGHIGGGYRWTKPGPRKRYAEVLGSVFQSWNFGGDTTWRGVWHLGYVELNNYYSIEWQAAYNPQTVNDRRTRGGPRTINPPGTELGITASTDNRKRWVFNLSTFAYESDASSERGCEAGVEWKPRPNLSVSASPGYEVNRQQAQWIDNFEDPQATHTYEHRYVFAKINQKTFSSSIRLNWAFSPRLSVQMYVQPLVSSGHYTDYKELARPSTFDFNHYDPADIHEEDGEIVIDPDGPGPADPIRFDDPNFNYRSLRGNTVVRWEYRPGSALYLVWTQMRQSEENFGDFRLRQSLGDLLHTKADNVFMIKFSYYWTP